MDDAAIAVEVIDKLMFEPGLRSHNIIVLVKDGIVTLNGSVRTYVEKYLTEQATKNLRGIKNVIDKLEVELDTSLQRSDIAIAEAIVNAIAWDASIKPTGNVEVTVENGSVILTGEVDDYYQKKRAAKCIKHMRGIKNIINHIMVRPIKISVDPQDVSKQIMREFQRNASLDAKIIHVVVDGSKVTLKGTVRSWAEKKEAHKAAWSVPGVTEVNDELVLGYVM
ncbi:MAG: BON domain-containing protein [Pseudomonadota bacterium]